MTRSQISLVLLSLWIFAIVAPSVIALLDNDLKSVVSINLNEEEPHEQGKKSLEEKKLIDRNLNDFSFLSHLENNTLNCFYIIGNSDPDFEVFIPPPEHIC